MFLICMSRLFRIFELLFLLRPWKDLSKKTSLLFTFATTNKHDHHAEGRITVFCITFHDAVFLTCAKMIKDYYTLYFYQKRFLYRAP